jgi:hypothetical protein
MTTTETTDVQDTGLGQPLPQNADPIDRVVRLSPPWTVFVLSACALLVAGAVLWAFTGVIRETVVAPGVVSDPTYGVVFAPGSATVDSVLVEPGDEVAVGDELVAYTDGQTTVAPRDGTVVIVFVAPQSQVDETTGLLGITDQDAPDQVQVLLPTSLIGTVVAGSPAQMEVNGAPASTYGYLVGEVQQVSSSPVTIDQLARQLSVDEALVSLALGAEPGILATIALEQADTPSGYAWTVGEGPDFQLVQGTRVTAQVILSEQSPIETLFPSLGGAS